jgi:hypothetical protein
LHAQAAPEIPVQQGAWPAPRATFVRTRTARLLVEVIGTKSEKPRLNAETNRILGIAGRTKLWTNFSSTSGASADIILKIQEDQTFVRREVISLTVFDPVNNEKLWSERRDLVDLDNDVSRLVASFLSEVAIEKKLAKENAERLSKQMQNQSNREPNQ